MKGLIVSILPSVYSLPARFCLKKSFQKKNVENYVTT